MEALGRVALVGGGNMGSALIKGMLRAGVAQAERIQVAEKDPDKASALSWELGVIAVAAPDQLGPSDLLILAVKPGDISDCARAAAGSLEPGTLVITLAAGVRLAQVAQALPLGQPLVRAMPNTPALVGQGVTALAPGPSADQAALDRARAVFEAVGQVVQVEEEAMDAVTGLSGSGPAYVFLLVEALAQAGVEQGLEPATALTLASQTVYGAGCLLHQGDKPPAQLREMVTSPGGTTEAGLKVLGQGGFSDLVARTVAAATARSRELGQ